MTEPRRPLPTPAERQRTRDRKYQPGSLGGRNPQIMPPRVLPVNSAVTRSPAIVASASFHSNGDTLVYGSTVLDVSDEVTGWGDNPDAYWSLSTGGTVVDFLVSGWYSAHANAVVSGLVAGETTWMECISPPVASGQVMADNATVSSSPAAVAMSATTVPFYVDISGDGCAMELNVWGPTTALVGFANIVIVRYQRDDF